MKMRRILGLMLLLALCLTATAWAAPEAAWFAEEDPASLYAEEAPCAEPEYPARPLPGRADLAAAAAPQAAGETSGAPEDFDYTLDEEKHCVVLSRYTGSSPAVTVPGAYEINGQSWRTVLDSETVFRGNTTLTSVTVGAGVGFLNDSMRLLFGECSKLSAVDLSEIDTAGVTNMNYVFYKCTALRSLDLSAFDTASVVGMYGMFSNCTMLSELTGYENWDTGSLEDMGFTFDHVASASKAGTLACIDLSRWDLDQLRRSAWCFQICRARQILLPDNLAIMSAGFLNHATKVTGSSFTIPAGVKKIGYAHTIYDFATDDFVEFIVAEGNEHYKAVDGILYSMDGTEMLAVPRNKPFENGVYEIPEGVTFLGELSFSRNYNIHTLVLPDSYALRYVPVYDEEYIVYKDTGNLNAGSNLSIAIYCYTGITDYAVKDTNPRYSSRNGLIYSKDGKSLMAVPARYAAAMELPEGTERWEREAMWADGGSTVDGLLKNCPGVSIPASLTYIETEQLAMLNRLHANRAGGANPFTITLDPANPAFRLNEDGTLSTVLAITAQPEDVNVPVGSKAVTGVKAVGSGLSYQWYGRDPGQEEYWTSSIRSRSYSVALVKSKLGRQVYCVVTDRYGNSVTSRTATLDALYPEGYAPPVIVTQPEDAYAAPGTLAVTSFTAEGTGLSYQWYLRSSETAAWSRSSLKGDSYSVTMVPAKAGRQVKCVVTDAFGAKTETNVVTLHMAVPEGYELRITGQPQSVVTARGKTARATVAAEGDGLKYQWYGRDPGQTEFWKSSIKTNTYSVTMIPAKSGREIYCVITDRYGNSVTSDTVTLTMKGL